MLEVIKTYLIDNYLSTTDDELAAALNMSTSTVQRKLRALGLRRRKNFMTMPEEIPGEVWRQIPHVPAYDASSTGRIRERKRGHLIQQGRNRYGYANVRLSAEYGVLRQFTVHRLVAAAFYGVDDRIVNHRDGNKLNNVPDNDGVRGNLEYATHAENCEHARLSGFLVGPSERISEEMARRICVELAEGRRCGEIAEALGVTLNVVKKIRARRTWVEVSTGFEW